MGLTPDLKYFYIDKVSFSVTIFLDRSQSSARHTWSFGEFMSSHSPWLKTDAPLPLSRRAVPLLYCRRISAEFGDATVIGVNGYLRMIPGSDWSTTLARIIHGQEGWRGKPSGAKAMVSPR